MRLETERLLIFPLNYEQLNLYQQPDNRLEATLNLAKVERMVPRELQEAFETTILPAMADPERDYLYSTLWIIVNKKHNCMVADLCFKGEPNTQGEVEIGYGTYDAFQGKGFMTEAIRAITAWVLSQPRVTAVIAETEKTNLPSHRTLEKNYFKPYKEAGDMIWWRLEKSEG